jgi:rubrerythrin
MNIAIETPKQSILEHKALVDLLKKAYSAEKAAAFAYQGHAGSVKNEDEKKAIRQIEVDEWNHRAEVLQIMQHYGIAVSKRYEFRFHVIGKVISASCYVIGWFMPFYFAGRLESGNVCEYFRMMQYFHELGIVEHNQVLYEMGIKEKEHEIYFLDKIKNKKLLPFFEKLFFWGSASSFNDVDLDKKYPVEASALYCKKQAEANVPIS